MVEIIIDGGRCDLWEDYSLPKEIFQLDVTAAEDVERQRSGHKVELRLPSTPQNDALMCYADDACCGERFNASAHEAVVRVDGVELMRGVAHLVGMEYEQGALSYRLRVSSGGSEWVESASLTSVGQALEYEATLNGDTIRESWSNLSPVKFLPVCYDDYRIPYDEHSLYPPQRVMTVGDYYPFLSVKELLREAVERGGYTLAGEWAQSKELQRLYMSGRYATVSAGSLAHLKAFAGFEAGRSSSSVAAADGQGRVWLSPLVLTSSLGAFVTTTDGEELYNSNGCLSFSNAGVVYKPATKQTVGFEYYLKYKTDYRIASRTRLKCFDAIYLGEGCDMEYQVANPFKDQRMKLQPNMEYLCVIFDHKEGTRYRLVCNDGTSQSVLGEYDDATFRFTVPMTNYRPVCSLMILSGDGSTQVYVGDWALYEGHVALMGETIVELTLQSPPEEVSPSVGRNFNQLYLHGAEPGQRVELSQECRLRPVFSPVPALGSRLEWATVAANDAQLINVVSALQQMYNLCIYTDESSKRVYVVPRDELGRGDEWDWSEKVCMDEPIEVEDLALGENERLTLAYRTETDGAVSRFNASAESPLGEWSGEVTSRLTLRGAERRVNPLFSPTISTAPYADAPSAMVMQVGDRDLDERSISNRIVRYEGLKSLPSGEYWGFPQNGSKYPLAAFHLPGQFSLCFEDRDGVEGLHRHYDEQLLQLALRRRVRLTLHLSPAELRGLGEWESEGANLRSTFILNLSGQSAKYRLEAVESYDERSERAVCRMVRQMND